MTVAAPQLDQLETFLTHLADADKSAHTIRNYRLDLRDFARWFEQSNGELFAAAAATRTDVRGYRSYLLTVKKAAPATINRRLAALRAFFGWARSADLVVDDPTAEVKSVERQKLAPIWLDQRQYDRYRRVVEQGGNKRDVAIVETLRHTGLRLGELAALSDDDVVVGERSGHVTVRAGKGMKARTVPLNADARRAIRAYREEERLLQAADGVYRAYRHFEIWSNRLFLGRLGEPLTANAIYDVVRKYVWRARIEHLTPHTLRHTFAKSMLDSGTDLVTLAALLGHESLDTLAVYTQPSASDMQRAVDRISD